MVKRKPPTKLKIPDDVKHKKMKEKAEQLFRL